jgi:Dolichyl-phosphate-mannose-protein mannosyltransferase
VKPDSQASGLAVPQRGIRAVRWSSLRPRYLIWTLVGVEVLLLVWWSTHPSPFIETHYGVGVTDGYNLLGRNLFEGHGYRFKAETGLTLRREPGFPLLLAAIYALFGRGLLQVRLVNLFAVGLAAGLLARMAARVSPGPVAPLLAPLLFLLHPGILIAELRIGVEIPFLLLSLCFLYVLDRADESRRLTAYAVAGLVLGLTSLVRSTALLFPLLLPLYYAFGGGRRPSIVVMGARILVVFAAAFLVLTPWTIRNYQLVGAPIATASIFGTAVHTGQYICQRLSFSNGFQALDYEAGDVRVQLARQQGYKVWPAQDPFFYDPRDEVRFSNWLTAQAMDEYRRSPLLFAKCAGENVFNFWFAGKNWTATLLNIPLQLAYLVLAVWGVRVYSRARAAQPGAPAHSGIGLYVLFCVYSMLVYLPTFAQARYSIPTVPLLALMGAVGIAAARRTGPVASSEPTNTVANARL